MKGTERWWNIARISGVRNSRVAGAEASAAFVWGKANSSIILRISFK